MPAAFETKSKKFEFSNADIAQLPAYAALKAPGDDKAFPLTLIPTTPCGSAVEPPVRRPSWSNR